MPKYQNVSLLMQRDFEQKSLIVTRSNSYLLRVGGSEDLCQNIKALVVATAAEDNHYRQDYYPSTVVVIKNVA